MAKVNNSPQTHSYASVPVVEADSGSHSSTTSAYKRSAAYSPNEWLLESISSAVALGLVVALATIFWSMDSKPLSAWNSRISLSTSISILTTAYAMAVMHGVSAFIGQSKWLHFRNKPRTLADLETFDQASRGLWGSALLLTTVKWNLATIGAVITVLRLSFAPFAQQVVLLEPRDVISPAANLATFGYAHNYSRAALFDSLNIGLPMENYPQDAGMQSAVFQGLYGINTTEPFACPGVCRWPGSFVSLGFKAQCTNVTQQALETATCVDQPDADRRCNVTTPGGVIVGYSATVRDAASYAMSASPLLDVDNIVSGVPDTFPEIMRFAILRSTRDPKAALQDVNITECSLHLTAYRYTDAKANGSDFSFASRQEVDFGAENPWFPKGVHLGGPFTWYGLATNETESGGIHVPALGIDVPNLQALESFLMSNSIVSEFVDGRIPEASPGVAAALTGDVDLNARFDGMATAMTNYIRYGPNTQMAYGDIILSETFVSIRWGYFAVPIAIETLAIVFAVLSIFNSRRSRNVPLWKSSTLAVLACRHNEQLGLLQPTGKGIDEIHDEAKLFTVQLQ